MGRAALGTQIEGFDRRVRALLEAFTAPDIDRRAVLDDVLQELSSILEAERRRYREFFLSAREGYLLTDEEGTIVDANPAAARLLGSSVQVLAGAPLSRFVTQADRPAFEQWLRRIHAREPGVADTAEANVETASRDRCFPCSFTFWRADGDAGHGPTLRWALEDLTERERASERDSRTRRCARTSSWRCSPTSCAIRWPRSRSPRPS